MRKFPAQMSIASFSYILLQYLQHKFRNMAWYFSRSLTKSKLTLSFPLVAVLLVSHFSFMCLRNYRGIVVALVASSPPVNNLHNCPAGTRQHIGQLAFSVSEVVASFRR